MVTIGVDEVGRGCWAGPLVAAAVYFYRPTGPDQELGPQLADSKQISARRREQAFELIVAQARVGLGWVSPQTIDQLGLTQAQTQAMDQALANLGPNSTPSQIIVDGVINYLAHYPTSRVQPGADRTVPTVMAASIVAKVCPGSLLPATRPPLSELGVGPTQGLRHGRPPPAADGPKTGGRAAPLQLSPGGESLPDLSSFGRRMIKLIGRLEIVGLVESRQMADNSIDAKNIVRCVHPGESAST